jgi:hypothetical protein
MFEPILCISVRSSQISLLGLALIGVPSSSLTRYSRMDKPLALQFFSAIHIAVLLIQYANDVYYLSLLFSYPFLFLLASPIRATSGDWGVLLPNKQ